MRFQTFLKIREKFQRRKFANPIKGLDSRGANAFQNSYEIFLDGCRSPAKSVGGYTDAMALPLRLWIPDGTSELPTAAIGQAGPAPRSQAAGGTVVPRLRRRALFRGEAGLPDRSVLVEWFPAADLVAERRAARRVAGLCHVHLLRLIDIGAMDSRSAYAVSEAPDGVDLFNVLRAAPFELPPWWGAAVVLAVTRALCALERQLSRGPRAGCGHGRVNQGTVFVGWDGGVRLLAFSPAGSASHRPEDIAPELRLSDRLLTSAADVYALGALLRDLLPVAARRRKEAARLLRRCLYPQAEKRIGLSALAAACEELLYEWQAPTERASAIGDVLSQCCPRATVDLLDADWNSSVSDGYPALPPTLAPLSPSTVQLSPSWLRPAAPAAKRNLSRVGAAVLPPAVALCALAALSLWGRPRPALPPPLASAPAAIAERAVDAAREPPSQSPLRLEGLRLSIEHVSSEPGRVALVVRLTNPGPVPVAPDLSMLRLSVAGAGLWGLAPLSPPALAVGAGRTQAAQLFFPWPATAPWRQISRQEVRLLTLSLREPATMSK